jgi:hypothetical protein
LPSVPRKPVVVTDRKVVSMSSAQLYDTTGATYTVTRRTEPRIEQHCSSGSVNVAALEANRS